MQMERKRHFAVCVIVAVFMSILFATANVYARDGGAEYREKFSCVTTPKAWSERTGDIYCSSDLDLYLEIFTKSRPTITKLRYYAEITNRTYIMKLPKSKWSYNSSTGEWKIRVRLKKIEGFTDFWVYDAAKKKHKVTCRVMPKLTKKIGTCKASNTESDGVKISWNAEKECDLNAFIYRASSAKGPYKKIANVYGSDGKFVDRTVQDGKRYYYKCRYVYFIDSTKKNGTLFGAFSKAVGITASKSPIKPSAARKSAQKAYKNYLNTVLTQRKLLVTDGIYADPNTWQQKWISNVDVNNIRYCIVDLDVGDGIPELLLSTAENPDRYLAYKYYGGTLVCFSSAKYEELSKLTGWKNVFVSHHSWKEDTYFYQVMSGKYSRTVAKIVRSSVYTDNTPQYYIGETKVSKSKFNSYMKKAYGVTSKTKLAKNQYQKLNRTNLNKL